MSSSDYKRFFSNPLIAIVLIILTGAVVYSNSLRGPFLFDDIRTIVENEKIREVSNFLGFDKVREKRPFGDLTFALNYRIGQLNVFGYHLVNIVIHLLNGLIVYFLSCAILRRLSASTHGGFLAGNSGLEERKRYIRKRSLQFEDKEEVAVPMISFVAALIFVVHPMQSQAVTYICQRYASLAAFFYLLSVFCYLKGRLLQRSFVRGETTKRNDDETDEKRVRFSVKGQLVFFYLLCILFGMFSFLSKQTAASLPMAILLVEYFCVDGTWNGWKRKLPWIGFLLLLGSFMMLYVVGGFQGVNSLGDLMEDLSEATRDSQKVSRWLYLCTQFSVVPLYIRLLFLPVGQNADPAFLFKTGFLDGWTPIWFVFLLGLILFAVWFRKKTAVISFGILWFFITLSVESSIIPIRDAMFEQRLYLPTFGFSIAVGYALFVFFQKKRALGIVVSFGLIMVFGTAAYERNKIWQRSDLLWADVVSKSPWNSRAHTNLGIALSQQGRAREAIAHFNESLKFKSGDPKTLINLGNALALTQSYDEAILIFQKLIAYDSENAKAHFNLGTALAHQGRVAEAERYFRNAIKFAPNFVDARINLGIAFMRQGKMEEATECFSRVLASDPKQKDAHAYLGLLLAKQGNFKDAEKELNAAIQIDPRDVRSRTNLGSVLARQGRIHEAIDQFREVLRIKPDSSLALKNLAILIKKNAEARTGLNRNSRKTN